MPAEVASLDEKAIMVLEAIANGYSYEQIIANHFALTYLDIFSAARDALAIIASLSRETTSKRTPTATNKTLSDYRKINPRAYEKWTEEEDEALIQLMQAGHGIPFIAELLKRKPSAIRSRLAKHNPPAAE